MKQNNHKWISLGSSLLACAGGMGLLILFFCGIHWGYRELHKEKENKAVQTEAYNLPVGMTPEELDRVLKQEQKDYWLSLTPTPSPTPSPSPSLTPSPSPSPSPTPTPSPKPSPTPEPSATPKPTATQ